MSTTVYALAFFGALAWFGWSCAERLYTQREKAKKDSEEMIRKTASRLAEFFEEELSSSQAGFTSKHMRIDHLGCTAYLYLNGSRRDLPYSFEVLDLLYKIVLQRWKDQEEFKRMYEMLITKDKGDTK